MKTKITILGVLLLLFSSIILACSDPASLDPALSVIDALERGNHFEAIQLANEIDSERLYERLESRIFAIETSFIGEETSFSAFIAELDTIDRMNITDLSAMTSNARNRAHNLNDSRTAFSTAESLFSRGDYSQAIYHYRQVIC